MAEIQSINLLNKALDIIELLSAQPGEMGVSAISRQLQLPKSGIYRILNSLKEREYVYQNPVSKEYGLGLKFYFIGASVQAKLPLCVLAKEVLDQLAAEENAPGSFQLAIPYLRSHKIPQHVYLYVTAGSGFPAVIINVGSILESNCCAAGLSIMAGLSDSELQVYRGCELKSCTSATIIKWPQLERELDKVRDKGCAVCAGTFSDRLTDLAVPVYDPMHCPIGSLALCAGSAAFKELDQEAMLRKLKRASAKITANFGRRGQ